MRRQFAHFAREGYIALDTFAAPAEMAAVRSICDRLFAAEPGGAVEDPERDHPSLLDTRLVADTRRIAQVLLGVAEEDLAVRTRFICKAPFSGTLRWHQDEAYWPARPDYRALTVWVALDDVGRDNGCLSFIPGSHAGGLLPHAIAGRDLVVGADREGVACPLPAGGATVHHCRTLHSSGPNQTDRPRRAFALIVGNRRTVAAGGDQNGAMRRLAARRTTQHADHLRSGRAEPLCARCSR